MVSQPDIQQVLPRSVCPCAAMGCSEEREWDAALMPCVFQRNLLQYLFCDLGSRLTGKRRKPNPPSWRRGIVLSCPKPHQAVRDQFRAPPPLLPMATTWDIPDYQGSRKHAELRRDLPKGIKPSHHLPCKLKLSTEWVWGEGRGPPCFGSSHFPPQTTHQHW